MVGVEDSMDELMTKVRFEEAKLKELSGRVAGSSQEPTYRPRGQSGGKGNQTMQVQYIPTIQQMPTGQGEQVKIDGGREM